MTHQLSLQPIEKPLQTSFRSIRWEMVMEAVPPVKFSNSADATKYLRNLGLDRKDREHFVVVLLDVKNQVLGHEVVSIGILDGSLIHPREVFKAAIVASAASIIVVHNHPSGDPSPSAEDREVTRRLRSAGGIIGIPVLDHVIIGRDRHYSFRESSDW